MVKAKYRIMVSTSKSQEEENKQGRRVRHLRSDVRDQDKFIYFMLSKEDYNDTHKRLFRRI